MKILVIGSGANGSLEGIYHRALLKLGQGVDFFDVDTHMSVSGIFARTGRLVNNRFTFGLRAAWAEKALVTHLSRNSNKYDVIVIFKGMQFTAKAIQEGRKINPSSTWVNINPDDPFNTGSVSSTNSDVIKSIPYFDLYCIWARRLMAPIRKAGCTEVMYLPFGYDEELHQPSIIRLPQNRSISFIGAWDTTRQATLGGLSNLDLRVFGNAWGRVSRHDVLADRVIGRDNIYGQELANETSSAAVSLNLMRSQNRGAHNMITFEVPAMGGLLLTTRSTEQEEYFPEGKACMMFDGNEELKEKITWILANPLQANRIRAEGGLRVVHHTYLERARQVLLKIRQIRGEFRLK